MLLNPPILVCVLCGVIYIVTGWIVLRYPPKKINDFYGYRTSRSKKSQAHWDFAQKESSKYIIQSGYYSLLTCIPFLVLDIDDSGVWIAIVMVTLYPFLSLIQTEIALKKKFG